MTMLLCSKKDCCCPHRAMLYYLGQGRNNDAKSALRKIQNFSQLADSSGRTLLHYAVDHWNKELSEYLIDGGCDVNAQDASGVSPLMMAVHRGERIVETLLKHDADVYAANCDGRSVFEQAFYCSLGISRSFGASAVGSSIGILAMIVDQVNDDFCQGKLQHWLSSARPLPKLILLTFGSAQLARFVLESGYPVDYRDEFTGGCTALHCAVALARSENARILMEHGASVAALDEEGCSPLHYYSPNFNDADDDSELLTGLLRCPDELSSSPPLERRCSKSVQRLLLKGKRSTVRTLLLSGIGAEARDNVLTCLVRNRNDDVLDPFEELDIGFDPNARTPDGNTLLVEAVRFRCPKKVEFLLRHGADVNMTTSNGKSALMCVDVSPTTSEQWQSDATNMIEWLLQYGSRDAQAQFNDALHLSDQFSPATRAIVAHLALLEAQQPLSLTDASRSEIQSKALFKAHFDLCTKQLDDMKDIKVHHTLTLFKLLTETDDKLVVHARNRQLTSAFSSSIDNLSPFDPYYSNFARTRLSRALHLAKLQDRVALVVEALTGLCNDAYHAIVYKIISYLDRPDLHNLCEIGRYPPLSFK